MHRFARRSTVVFPLAAYVAFAPVDAQTQDSRKDTLSTVVITATDATGDVSRSKCSSGTSTLRSRSACACSLLLVVRCGSSSTIPPGSYHSAAAGKASEAAVT